MLRIPNKQLPIKRPRQKSIQAGLCKMHCCDLDYMIPAGCILARLFDFDVEVKPILEVIVGKTVEQSLLEVMEEEELANLRKQQREFEELRNAELVEQQRLEEQERRHKEEKEEAAVEKTEEPAPAADTAAEEQADTEAGGEEEATTDE
nr:hypothetical protein BaRGS_022835 [Batillaria attramentaria]